MRVRLVDKVDLRRRQSRRGWLFSFFILFNFNIVNHWNLLHYKFVEFYYNLFYYIV